MMTEENFQNNLMRYCDDKFFPFIATEWQIDEWSTVWHRNGKYLRVCAQSKQTHKVYPAYFLSVRLT